MGINSGFKGLSIPLMHRYGTLNFNGFISDGRLLIKLQVRGTALLKSVVKNFEKKKFACI